MKKIFRYSGVLSMALMLMPSHAVQAAQSQEAMPVVYAAGSLHASIDSIIQKFGEKTGIHFVAIYGLSGKLRSDIETGTSVSVFASASKEHTEALVKEGLLKNSIVFARNSMCLLAGPEIDIKHGDLVNKMLERDMTLGTSTPKMDPGGDYTWLIFQNAEKIHPGAYASLDQKAQRLVGNPALPPRSIPDMIKNHEIDLFVTYCSSANGLAGKIPGATWKKFPKTINVEANYGIGAATNSDARSDLLIRFILSDVGQKILSSHGFDSVINH
ncbi:MAG: substrate-binding domain-containing protein [Rhodoferax sp.]